MWMGVAERRCACGSCARGSRRWTTLLGRPSSRVSHNDARCPALYLPSSIQIQSCWMERADCPDLDPICPALDLAVCSFSGGVSQDASLRTGPVNMPRSPPSGVFDGTVTVSDSAAVGYRLFLHPEAEAEPSRIPLLVYFHGNGEVARDCERSFSRTRAPLLGPSR